jgi:t-SNARE complex subunit (syntaxin)
MAASVMSQSFSMDSIIEYSDSLADEDEDDVDTVDALVFASRNRADGMAEVRQALKKDDRGVSIWRLAFKILMILVAVVLTIATYVQLSRAETRDFTNAVSFC